MNRILMLFLMLCSIPSFAQEKSAKQKKKELRKERIDAIIRQEEEGVIKYRKHTVIGLKATNDGYGGFFEIARAQTLRKALLFQLEISERKHPKEIKADFAPFQISPIIFGKANHFYPVKLGVQQQYLLGNKSNKNGVSITANFGGGISLGLLRPYTIEVVDGNKLTKVTYYSDSAKFLNTSNYHNNGGFFSGWSDLKLVPGIYAKPSLRFEFGMYNEMVNAIEVGLHAEYYTKGIEQMLFMKQDKFFFGGFVSFVFGRRK